MSVRKATPADADAVAALVAELGYTTGPDELRERLAWFAAAAHDVVLVAERDGGVAGFVGVGLLRSVVDPEWFARITALSVGSAHRRAGVGAELVAAAEGWAAERGSTLMQVNSGRRPEREAAHAFYPALGYHDQHDHHVLYEKPLTPAVE